MILLCAEHFAEALVASGEALGVSEFLLVQWVAPLASEAPELLVAGLYAWRLNTNAGLGTLVCSKVNQWTLLVGTLPIVFAIAAGGLHGLPLDTVQREELFLTAAQSFFAVAVISNLSMSLREAGFLFGLFWAQFILGGDRAGVAPRRRADRRRHRVPGPGCVGAAARARLGFAGCSATGSERSYDELVRRTRGRCRRGRGDARVALAAWTPARSSTSSTADTDIASSLVHVRTLPARAPAIEPFPDGLPDLLVVAARA